MKRKVVSFWFAIVCLIFSAWNGSSQGLITPPTAVKGLTHQYSTSATATTNEDYAASGQFAQSGFTATITGSELIVASFESPAGQMFVIHDPPDGFGNITLELLVAWRSSPAVFATFSPSSLSFAFENLSGSDPTPIMSSSGIGTAGNFISFRNSFSVSAGTSFTGIQLNAQFASSIISPSEQTFAPVDYFTFRAFASGPGILEDGILMTLEPIPEPSVLALVFLGSGVLLFATKRRPL